MEPVQNGWKKTRWFAKFIVYKSLTCLSQAIVVETSDSGEGRREEETPHAMSKRILYLSRPSRFVFCAGVFIERQLSPYYFTRKLYTVRVHQWFYQQVCKTKFNVVTKCGTLRKVDSNSKLISAVGDVMQNSTDVVAKFS